MMSTLNALDSQHEDLVHDAQMDFCGKRLATCSSDKTVRIFQVTDNADSSPSLQPLDILRGHDGPVWQVAWAPPQFGATLASCGYDGRVIVWKESISSSGSTTYAKLREHKVHDGSVNGVAFAPMSYDQLMLACASSDGKVSVLRWITDESSPTSGTWSSSIFPAHDTGVFAVSWCPRTDDGLFRLASAGGDNMVRIWVFKDNTWRTEHHLQAHTDWVRDVAFAPYYGLKSQFILASASQDRVVFLWTVDSGNPVAWRKQPLKEEPFPEPVWRVSWSTQGNILSVAYGENKVALFRETAKGTWECLSQLEEPLPHVPAPVVAPSIPQPAQSSLPPQPSQQQPQHQPQQQQQQQQAHYQGGYPTTYQQHPQHAPVAPPHAPTQYAAPPQQQYAPQPQHASQPPLPSTQQAYNYPYNYQQQQPQQTVPAAQQSAYRAPAGATAGYQGYQQPVQPVQPVQQQAHSGYPPSSYPPATAQQGMPPVQRPSFPPPPPFVSSANVQQQQQQQQPVPQQQKPVPPYPVSYPPQQKW